MFIDTNGFCCYYIPVRLCTGGVRVSLNELASEKRITGSKSLIRALRQGKVAKIFLSKEAEEGFFEEILEQAGIHGVSVEWAEDSLQLGRACAVSRKTAAAGLFKK